MGSDPVIEQVRFAPHPRLRPFVTRYTGYRLAGLPAGVHAGLPSRSLTMIVAFDEPLDVAFRAAGTAAPTRRTYWGVLGGLHTEPAQVHHTGRQHGIQLEITPRGAAALFGLPAGELGSRLVDLDEVVPAEAPELIERLSSVSSWRARFAVLDSTLLRLCDEGRVMAPELVAAWEALVASHGDSSVADLAGQVGWNRRHFTQRFRAGFGLPPKAMARILRFERAQQLLRLPTRPSLASIAASCGYADQAHLTREWRAFTGSSPTAWLADEVLPFVQDVGTGEEETVE